MKKLLLVDDDHDTLDMLEILLYRMYDITTALNGFEGLTMARDLAPHCIITDIAMPIMDGIQFFNSLRRQRQTQHTPVIAMTSFVKKHNIRSLKNIGFSEVILKPVQPEPVREAIDTALRRSLIRLPRTGETRK